MIYLRNGVISMKKILAGLLIVISVFAFTGYSNVVTTTQEKKTIIIGVMPDEDSVPFIMADYLGYFKKEGVNVKLLQFKSAKDRDSAIQGGKLDGAIADILTVLFNNEGGFDVKITSKTDGNYKLLAGKKSGIKDLTDLKGKSIAISKNTLIEYLSDKILASVHYSDKDIHKVIVPQIPLRLEMLQNNKIDGATLPEPMASLAIKNGAKLIYDTKNKELHPGILLFTSKVLRENPEDIKAIYRAYNEAVNYINTHPIASYIDIVIKKAGFPEQIKKSIKLPAYTKAEMPRASDFNNVLAWMRSKGLIKGNYSLKDVSDSSFVR
jgi:NitT/TauT family transport system substrate-binding protein